MKNETLRKVTEYAKTRFTRLLILLVIFTFGFSMKTAVLAKYTSYINNLTSVVAGDFIFKSDYLDENGITYTINSYNGAAHEIEFDLMNYENSLRYNQKGLDCFYTVDAQVYQKDANNVKQNVTGQYNVKITYGEANADVAAYRAKVNDQGKLPNSKVRYGVLRGLDIPADKTYMDVIGAGQGKNTIKVYIEANEPMTTGGTIYLEVKAYTVSTPVMKEETVKSDADLSGRIGQYVIQTTEACDNNVTISNRGVYYVELSGTFVLNHTTSDATMITEVYPGASTNYEVIYKIRCNDSTNGTVTAKVYYDSAVVLPDSSIGTSNYDREKKKRYFQVQCQPGGTLSMVFYKRSLESVIVDENGQNDTFITEVVTDSTQLDENEYSISSAESAEGEILIEPDKAKMTKEVTVKVTPPDNMMINEIFITTIPSQESESAFDVPIYSSSVDRDGKGTFKFKMPNENVSVLPTYCYKILLDCEDPNGSATLSRTGAPVGTPISVLTYPKEGYKAKVNVKGSGEAFAANDDGNNAYSFTMPQGLTTVTVVFELAETETPEGIDTEGGGMLPDPDNDDEGGSGGGGSGSE